MGHIPTRNNGTALMEPPERSFSEILAQYSVVSAHDDFVVVTPRDVVSSDTAIALADPTVRDLSEIGAAGGTQYQHYLMEDYVPELRGIQGIRTYDRMRRNDGTVRKSLRLIKTPVMAARWYVEAASDSAQDKEIAEYVWKNLTKGMSITWWQVLVEALSMIDFGYYIFEKVYEFGPDGNIKLKKLAPRHPIDVTEWEYDSNGGPVGVWMSTPQALGRSQATSGNRPFEVFIPIEKLVVFSFDREANNIRGMSMLRSAYKHWYFKEQLYKIDAIQKERHGIGIPIIKLPPGFTPKDRQLANEIGRNLRTNEKAHVVLPPNWEIEFVKIEGQPVNALDSAAHHDRQILGNVLGDFLNTEATASTAVEQQWAVFQKATAFIAEIIKDSINKWVIPELVDFNWRVEEYPELRVRRIGETTDWRTISFAIRNFIGAEAIYPDEELEEWIREEMDLPHADMSSRREPATPQNAGQGGARTGPPRQSSPTSQPQRGNAGQDRSGGQ